MIEKNELNPAFSPNDHASKKRPKILTDAGYEIYCDVKKLQRLDLPVKNFQISKLIWNFKIPFWEKDNTEDWNLTPWQVIRKIPGSRGHFKRMKKADLSYPILITKKKNKWLIIDGVHRLVKTYLAKNKTIKAKLVSAKLVKKYEI